MTSGANGREPKIAARLALLWLLLAALLAVSCNVEVGTINHDYRAAAAEAEEFLRLCTVEGDITAAYAMFGDEVQAKLSLPTFTEQMELVSAAFRPRTVRATSWELLPGEEALQIYLEGYDPPRVSYYRVVMEGTLEAGYRPFAVFRSEDPYPESSSRQTLD